jgi:hypothetical protein
MEQRREATGVHIFAVSSLIAIFTVLSFFSTSTRAQVVASASATARYLQQPASTAAPKTIALTLEGSFNADETANIQRAVQEWNHALNGFIRLDLVAGRGGSSSWSIRAERGGSPHTTKPGGQPLASSQTGFLGIGGTMLIYVDRIGTRDLRGIVMHEIGHVLGLNHDHGNLMSARYQPTGDQCIDRATIETVAARHSLPAASLNWCEPRMMSAK